MHKAQQGHQTWYILSLKVGSERIFVLVNFSNSDFRFRALGEGRLS